MEVLGGSFGFYSFDLNPAKVKGINSSYSFAFFFSFSFYLLSLYFRFLFFFIIHFFVLLFPSSFFTRIPLRAQAILILFLLQSNQIPKIRATRGLDGNLLGGSPMRKDGAWSFDWRSEMVARRCSELWRSSTWWLRRGERNNQSWQVSFELPVARALVDWVCSQLDNGFQVNRLLQRVHRLWLRVHGDMI